MMNGLPLTRKRRLRGVARQPTQIRSGENIGEPSSGPTWRINSASVGLGQGCSPRADGGDDAAHPLSL